jgi:hypothetical protein
VNAVTIETLFKVEVIVGAVLLGNLNEAGQVIALDVPSPTNNNTNELVLEDGCKLLIVSVVIFAFNVTTNTVPVFRLIVNVPEDIEAVVCPVVYVFAPTLPTTCKVAAGLVVPIPTHPFATILRRSAFVV